MPEVDPLITNYSHLRDQPREKEALLTLQRIASLVKPLMRQRGWRVGTLAEFYPPDRTLLGVNWNKGQKICLRLRYPSDATQFLPLEHVVDTMLHELSHIVHNDHDQHFHALWEQLRDEHEQLTRKGYTGDGFLSQGRKLGGRGIPMDEARRRARAAAENRKLLNTGSGQRLGGTSVARGADMRSVITDAIQRRLTVTRGCASGTDESRTLADHATRNGFRTQAEEDDANERAIMQAYIELLQEEEKEKWGKDYMPPSQDNPGGMSETRIGQERMKRSLEAMSALDQDDESEASFSRASRVKTHARSTTNNTSGPPDPDPKFKAYSLSPELVGPTESFTKDFGSPAPQEASFWECPICTLHNALPHLCCSACGIERPLGISRRHPAAAETDHSALQPKSLDKRLTTRGRPPNSGSSTPLLPQGNSVSEPSHVPGWWQCKNCGQSMEQIWWTCDRCGIMKKTS